MQFVHVVSFQPMTRTSRRWGLWTRSPSPTERRERHEIHRHAVFLSSYRTDHEKAGTRLAGAGPATDLA